MKQNIRCEKLFFVPNILHHIYLYIEIDGIYADGNFYLVFSATDLLSDLQASMLSWFRFHSRVNSSLTKDKEPELLK